MKLSLSKFSFLNIILIVFVFSFLVAFFIYEFNKELYEKRITALENEYYKRNEVLIKTEVSRALKKIDIVKEVIYKKNELILKEKVNFIKNLFDGDETKTDDVNSLLSRYYKELELLKWDNGTGYFYIFDASGNILYHGGNNKYVNKNIFELSKYNVELHSFLKETLVRSENFGSYAWYKPNEDPKEVHRKYVYIKKDEKYDIFIAAGVYKDEIVKKAQKIIFDEFRNDRFGDGNYNYFWIVGLDKIMRMHPIQPQSENKRNKLYTIDGKLLIDVILKKISEGGGYVNYTWHRPDNNKIDEKISYVKQIPTWDLIIGTGFYMSELKLMLKNERENLKKISDEYLRKMLMVISILIVIAVFIARYISKKIDVIEVERKEQMNMLEQYKLLLDNSSVVSKTDKKGLITYVNRSFEKISGYEKEEILGKDETFIRHPSSPKSQFRKLWRTILNGKIWKGILKNIDKSGNSYYNSTTIIPIKNAKGEIFEFISSGTDVTELIENRTKLKKLFKMDSLTGLGNRVSLIDFLSDKEKGVLALINIDRFKEINDSYSHGLGDEVIKVYANRLFEYFNDKNYYIFRVQADVFALFNAKKSIEEVHQDIVAFMNEEGKGVYIIGENKFILTYTSGIASDNENLFTYADIALDEAKRSKVKIKEYNESMASIDKFKNNIQWVERLSIAIQEDNIVPHFQPIFNYKTKKIEKYEALMRLIEGDKIIYPNEYLDIAKKTKLYPELTYKMVEKVISKFSSNNLEFSINLSVEDLMNEELMIFIADYAEQKDVFNRMVLEIVESEEIEDSDYIKKLINEFKQKGAKIAIDDFGSGYSNYEYLISLQVDYLKIDGSIIKLILSDNRTLDLVKSMVKFAKNSNIKVIAEFVSDENIDKVLKEVGVDYAQGFYYGKPQEDLLEG